MTFSDTDIDAMLKATGQPAIIDDGSVAGLTVWCKFVEPEQIVTEFGVGVEATDPAVKVRKSAIINIDNLRGRRLTTGGKDYTIKTCRHRVSGFSFIALEDA